MVSSGSSTSSRISATRIQNILLNLNGMKYRKSTCDNYLGIWRSFNKFLILLDFKPETWEERTALFLAHLIDNGVKSATVKSYLSAIKSVLKDDKYDWDESRVLFSSITRACKYKNDQLTVRLPITGGLLEILLFELERVFPKQGHLECLYKAMFALAFYGLFRIGEVCFSQHVIKACYLHVGSNKDKILVVLYSSKTHGGETQPQKVKITSAERENESRKLRLIRNFCPFELIKNYLIVRGDYVTLQEPFFIFADRNPVKQKQARALLKSLLKRIGLNEQLYDFQSFRIGRASQMAKCNYSISEIRRAGRWRSNSVYRYIRQ